MAKIEMQKEFKFEEVDKYKGHYSEYKLFNKFSKIVKKTGAKVIYPALLLYLVLVEKNTPIHIKTTILGALGYLISPIDCIPDAIIGVGLGDDLSAILIALNSIRPYITEDTKSTGRKMMTRWFGEVSDSDFYDLEKLMGI